jgi:hypothetical protein
MYAAAYSAAPPGTIMQSPGFVATERYRATVAARRYVHMLTEAPDSVGHNGFSFIRLDKDTGAESGRVWVDRRNPSVALDAGTGTVYLLVGKSTINALRF